MEEAGNVLISALEVHITSDADNKTTKNPEGGADHAVLADPILVPIITTDETCQQTSNVQDEKMEDGRLALICSKRKAFGNLEEDNVEFLTHVQRSKTHKNYNAGWKKWTQWCKTQPNSIQPTTYDEAIVLRFLLDNRQFSYQYLNGLRSAIASVFKVLHPEKGPLATKEVIAEFFKARRRSEINIPTKQKLQTWNTNILVDFIGKEWPDNQPLNLYDLQLKTILLFCLATMARPRSDVGRVQFRDV